VIVSLSILLLTWLLTIVWQLNFEGVIYMSLFSAQGEMNASNIKDALSTLVKYAAILEEGQPANTGLAGQPSINDNSRDDLIARAILTQDGKIALAQAMANPIRRNLDYQGIARRLLVVDPLNVAAMAA
jgi:hypothetical protein